MKVYDLFTITHTATKSSSPVFPVINAGTLQQDKSLARLYHTGDICAAYLNGSYKEKKRRDLSDTICFGS